MPTLPDHRQSGVLPASIGLFHDPELCNGFRAVVDGFAGAFDPGMAVCPGLVAPDTEFQAGIQAGVAHPPAKRQRAGQAAGAGNDRTDPPKGRGAALPDRRVFQRTGNRTVTPKPALYARDAGEDQ